MVEYRVAIQSTIVCHSLCSLSFRHWQPNAEDFGFFAVMIFAESSRLSVCFVNHRGISSSMFSEPLTVEPAGGFRLAGRLVA
jgi:hypothetical protein